MKRVAVVILNWNGRHLMERFLPPLLSHTPEELADLVVADNGSTDGSLAYLEEYYPNLIRIPLDRNYGFAEGYNRALEPLTHEYAVFLNSDVEVSPGWLEQAVSYLDAHQEVAALQPKICSWKDRSSFEYAGAAGGYIDVYGYPFCRGRIFDTVERDRGQYDSPAEILWASGACLIIRLDEYKRNGGLDARFFAHQEEIDLCWRLNARGRKVVCFPGSLVYHVGGATLGMEHPRKTFLNFRNNHLMLYKNLPDGAYRKMRFFRFFMDIVATLRFLLLGAPKNAWAVVRADLEFRKMKGEYRAIREENLKKAVVDIPQGIMKKSLLVEYYIRGKKRFRDLGFGNIKEVSSL